MVKRPKRFYAPEEWAIFWGIIAFVVSVVALGGYLAYRAATRSDLPSVANSSPIFNESSAARKTPDSLEWVGEIPASNLKLIYQAWASKETPTRYVLRTKNKMPPLRATDGDVSGTYIEQLQGWYYVETCGLQGDPWTFPPNNTSYLHCGGAEGLKSYYIELLELARKLHTSKHPK